MGLEGATRGGKSHAIPNRANRHSKVVQIKNVFISRALSVYKDLQFRTLIFAPQRNTESPQRKCFRFPAKLNQSRCWARGAKASAKHKPSLDSCVAFRPTFLVRKIERKRETIVLYTKFSVGSVSMETFSSCQKKTETIITGKMTVTGACACKIDQQDEQAAIRSTHKHRIGITSVTDR